MSRLVKQAKSILCAIDFQTPASERAIRWALKEAEKRGDRLIILFCYRLIPNAQAHHTALKQISEQAAISKMNSIALTLDPKKPASYEFVTEVGFYSSRIESYLEKGEVRLLVASNSIFESVFDPESAHLQKFVDSLQVPIVLFSNRVPEAA